MKRLNKKIQKFESLCKEIKELLDKVTDILLDSYTGTPTEKSALTYIQTIKTFSDEIDSKMSLAKQMETKQALICLDNIETLIEKRNHLLNQLGILV